MGKVGHALNPGRIGKKLPIHRKALPKPSWGLYPQTPPLSPLFVILWEKAGKGISAGRKKFLPGQPHSPGEWRCKCHGDKMESKWECQAESEEEIKYHKMPFPLRLLFASGITAEAADFQLCFPHTLLGSRMGADPAPRYTSGNPEQHPSAPSSQPACSTGTAVCAGEECHREDAFTRWL